MDRVGRRGFLKALGLTSAAAVTPAVVRRAAEEAPTDVLREWQRSEALAPVPVNAESYAPGKTCVCGGTDFSIGRLNDEYEQAVCDLCTLELAQIRTEMEASERERQRQTELYKGSSYGVPMGKTLRHLPVRDFGTGEPLDAIIRQWEGWSE